MPLVLQTWSGCAEWTLQAGCQIHPMTFDTNGCSPLVLDMSLYPMQLFAKHAAWLKIQHTLVPSAKTNRETQWKIREWVHINPRDMEKSQCRLQYLYAENSGKWFSVRMERNEEPVVDNLHCPILLNPQFTQNNIMHTAHRVCPCVSFSVSEREREKEFKTNTQNLFHKHIRNMLNNKWTFQHVTYLAADAFQSNLLYTKGRERILPCSRVRLYLRTSMTLQLQ